MANRNVSVQRFETRLCEDLGDQPHVLVDHDVTTVADRDSGRLLTAMLQCVKAEVREFGDFLPRGPDPEDAASVLRPLLIRKKVVGESTIASDHIVSVLPELHILEEPTTAGHQDADSIAWLDVAPTGHPHGNVATPIEFDHKHAVVPVVGGGTYGSGRSLRVGVTNGALVDDDQLLGAQHQYSVTTGVRIVDAHRTDSGVNVSVIRTRGL